MITSIITGLAGWVFTKFVGLAGNGILNNILAALGKSQDQQTTIAVEVIKAEMDARRSARDIRLATAGFWEMRLITFVIAGCFVSHLVLVWFDTITSGTRFEVEGWNVAAFPSPFNEWEGAIILSFFGIYGGLKALNTVSGVVAKWLGSK